MCLCCQKRSSTKSPLRICRRQASWHLAHLPQTATARCNQTLESARVVAGSGSSGQTSSCSCSQPRVLALLVNPGARARPHPHAINLRRNMTSCMGESCHAAVPCRATEAKRRNENLAGWPWQRLVAPSALLAPHNTLPRVRERGWLDGQTCSISLEQ